QRPTICLLKADTVNKRFWMSNRKLKLYTSDYDFKKIDSVDLTSPASSKADSLITLMGVMDPNDQPAGSIMTLGGKTIIESLKRPVDLQREDLNNDGKKD